MPKIKEKQINLLPQDEFQSSTFGRVLKWALSTFRVMVIVTELVVMSAFLSRFWLDARNSDLNENLNIKKSQIQAYSKVESDFRVVQNQIEITKTLYNQGKISTFLEALSNSIPNGVNLTTISMVGQDLQIKATSFNESLIVATLNNLDKSKVLADVVVNQLATDQETNAIVFTILAKVTNSKGVTK